MVIDQRIYEKYSGKSGDPYDKLGAAYAQMDARRGERERERDFARAAIRTRLWRFGVFGLIGVLFVRYPRLSLGALVTLVVVLAVLMTM